MERTPDSTRQLASRARRRVQAAPQPEHDVALQRRVVVAFLAAACEGDFDALLDVLAPDVVLRFDFGAEHGQPPLVGADAVARHVLVTAPPRQPGVTDRPGATRRGTWTDRKTDGFP